MNAISIAIEQVGGPIGAAKACGIRRQAIDKWLIKGVLPRTDYTGETNYAERLADASSGQFTAAWLLAEAAPKKTAA
ncbi:MAG: helix-turn-helix domain-containing protein [Pseudomonadaceae bacterium]|nr:helix-turn-helix domain-containing protein [Pseudomonadaceae bacterium]